MDNQLEDFASEDNSSVRQANANRLIVTHEGLLDQTLLTRTEGFMHKKGGAVNARGGFRNWKKRWFVIAEVDILGAQGFELQYYDAPNGNLKGKVGLSDIEIFCETKSLHKKVKYEFQIILQNGGVLQLSCDDSKERDEWVETLNMITIYLRKVLTSGGAMTLDGYDPHDDDDEENFNIGEELAQNCQAFGPGLFGSEAGVPSQLVVQVHDLVGQQVTKGGMPITVSIVSADAVYYARVIDNEDGSYFTQYVMGRAGKYKLLIRLNDEHDIFGSPFDIEILPSRTIARFCVAHGEALDSITANDTQEFTIVAMDGFGNRKTNGGDPFEVGVMGPAQLKSLTDNGDGSYTCVIAAMNPTTSSYVTSSSLMVMVTLHGKAIAGSPFKPVVVEDVRAQFAVGNSSVGGSHYTGPTGASSVVSQQQSVSPAQSRTSSFHQQSSYQSKHLMAQQQQQPGSVSSAVKSTAELDADLESYMQSSAHSPTQSSQQFGGEEVSSAASRRSQHQHEHHHEQQAPVTPSSATSVASETQSQSQSRRVPPQPPSSPPPTNAASVNPPPQVAPGSGRPLASAAASAAAGASLSQAKAGPSATSAAAAAAVEAGGGLSRLERSRQRALLAKALAESSSAANDSSGNNAVSAPSVSMSAAASGAIDSISPAVDAGGRKLTKLEEIQRTMAATSLQQQQQAQQQVDGNNL
jgi:hypothetical protein